MSTYRIVVIDDERKPPPLDGGEVLLYKTLAEGLEALQYFHSTGEQIDELWLDHDLGYNPEAEFGWDTIMPLVTWLEEMGHAGDPLKVRYIFVHTSNASAAPQMIAALRPYYTVGRAELPR